MCFSIGLYLPLLLGGEGKECLYQHRRDNRTQPASVAVIIAEGWHMVKGQQPRTSFGTVSLVYLSSRSRHIIVAEPATAVTVRLRRLSPVPDAG